MYTAQETLLLLYKISSLIKHTFDFENGSSTIEGYNTKIIFAVNIIFMWKNTLVIKWQISFHF